MIKSHSIIKEARELANKEDFTFETVERIIKAICLYIKNINTTKKTFIVGYDPRFMAVDFAKFSAELLKNNGAEIVSVDIKNLRLFFSHHIHKYYTSQQNIRNYH